jgi:hypothetical protein
MLKGHDYMKAIKFFTLIAVITLLISCSYEVTCEDTSITPVFIKYQPSDIDTLVIRKYTLNSNFSNQTDSIIIESGYSGYYITHNDTTIVQLFSERLKIESGFDWQIYIPAKNKTINISEINSPKTTAKCSSDFFSEVGCGCFNPIISCKLNNQFFTFDSKWPNYNIYILN